LIEIQIRTMLQHLWAELSEKLSDIIDASIKYGGGSDDVQQMLLPLSEMIAKYEKNTKNIDDIKMEKLNEEKQNNLQKLHKGLIILKAELSNSLKSFINKAEDLRRTK